MLFLYYFLTTGPASLLVDKSVPEDAIHPVQVFILLWWVACAGFGAAWRVPHAGQEVLTLPEHLISLSFFMGVRVVPLSYFV